jgi:glucosamine--fructose-6-phosphate aminotransferase (isomerizing)
MCGIVGYVGSREATPIVLSALKKLEYRGYDSAGIAGLYINGGPQAELEIRRTEGAIDRLEQALQAKPVRGTTALAHTRWATHGKPSEKNAHPHRFRDVVIVHNGIVENYQQLREELSSLGHRFSSDTDSEVIAHLLQRFIDQTKGDFEKSCFKLVKKLKGAFAIGAIWVQNPKVLFVAKQHSPLLLGLGDGENFVASDIPALLAYTRDFLILSDGELAFVEPSRVRLFDFDGKSVQRKSQHIDWSVSMAEKEGYEHFMLKEIHEQPRVIQDTLRGRVKAGFSGVEFDSVRWPSTIWKRFDRVSMVACGSAWHAGLIGKHWIEQVAKVHAEADWASEFRYRKPILSKNTLSVAISQSGETADTLAAIQQAKALRSRSLSITNTVESSIVRSTKEVIYTHAGPEISVASTKCFLAQMTSLALLEAKLAETKRTQKKEWIKKFLKDLSALPQSIEKVIAEKERIREIVRRYKDYEQYFYLGRGISYPIALEGALKLKEIAYINTQAYPGGEMKHGPIALISDQWPVVCVAPEDSNLPKMISNMEAVKARGGHLVTVGTEGCEEAKRISDAWIPIPKVREELSPFLSVVVLQLYAYYMAVERGCNVDKPKNLAKSVTVE